ncbi:MAG TPA: sulfotransferase [Actinomycetota bacterium]|nr:sulfotransferase [Actinomycetota bacterium]
MTLPNFVVVGAMKTGTTSLYHYLRAHPEVFMPRVKELDFFLAEANWERGLRWYERRFAAVPPRAKAVGEASTNYSKFPQFTGVPERMAAVIPHARIVYVVRDPVDRILSHYRHRVAVGSERRPINVAIRSDPTYINASRYAMQAHRFLRHYPRERMLIMASEALKNDRSTVIEAVYRFLGVDPSYRAPVHTQEFYRTDARTIHSPIAWHLRTTIKRRFPAAKEAKELVDAMRGAIRHNAHRPAARDRETAMPDALRRELTGRLIEDTECLRALAGDIVGSWDLT